MLAFTEQLGRYPAKYLLSITSDIYDCPELRYNKNSIVISSSGYNQMVVRKRSGNNVLVRFRYGSKREEIMELLESNGVQYNEQHQRFSFQMAPDMFKQKEQMFVHIAKLNKEWWVG